jgi:hypothetical protein
LVNILPVVVIISLDQIATRGLVAEVVQEPATRLEDGISVIGGNAVEVDYVLPDQTLPAAKEPDSKGISLRIERVELRLGAGHAIRAKGNPDVHP